MTAGTGADPCCDDGQARDSALESMPSFLLNHIVHQYHQILQARLKSLGVSTLKMRIIMSLKLHGSLSVNELCGFAIAEQPTMSRALDSLEAQGLIYRAQSEQDSRLRLAALTEAGEQVFDRIQPEILQVNAQMTRGLTPAQQQALMDNLGEVLARLRDMPRP